MDRLFRLYHQYITLRHNFHVLRNNYLTSKTSTDTQSPTVDTLILKLVEAVHHQTSTLGAVETLQKNI